MLPEDASIMAFGAHAADYCFRAGGTLIKYAQKGARVKAFCATFGERGESKIHWSKGATLETVKEIRRKEASEAASILGINVEFLDWDDNPLIMGKERLMLLADKIGDFQPDIILTHYPGEHTYPDHQNFGQAVVHAARLFKGPLVQNGRELRMVRPRIFFWEPDLFAQPVLDFAPDTYVDITDTAEQKFDAVHAYADTQPGLEDRWPSRGKMRAMEARTLGSRYQCQYAEAFKRYFPFVGDRFI
ncbi:PIG-L family deacetylase [Chloroflexi bacterium TSY]|nr:PIG-L family deacetylase [Chloroflexi bacterium TSY]